MNISADYRLKNDLAQTRQIEGWVREFAGAAQLSSSVRQALDLSLVEWVTNIISYAYTDDAEHWITIHFATSPGEARVEIEDDGREFNPLTRPSHQTPHSLRGLTRRELLRGAASLGGMWLLGCGSSSSAQTDAGGAATDASAPPPDLATAARPDLASGGCRS